MRSFCRTLIKISKLKTNAFINKSYLFIRANVSPSITPNRIEMAFNVYQSKQTNQNLSPIIFMHDILGSKSNWEAICTSLETKTLRKIYNVDARNHGDSPHVSEHNAEFVAADLKFFMEQENLNRVSLIGHSMGGRAMMYFAMRYPKLVENAIIIDISPVSMPKTFDSLQDILLAMKNLRVPSNLSPANGKAFAARELRELIESKQFRDFILLNLKKLNTGEFVWSANVAAFHANFQQIREQKMNLPSFNGPVLFVCGKKSDYFDPKDWPKITQLFPKAKLEWLDCGHLVHLDQPEQFCELVFGFLTNVPYTFQSRSKKE